ncbi:MAG: GntR family transcriptional regulator [Gemmatimonadota bacterium]|nr:GntR family transcriptional regulator [Gemmatimonadota bacterium]
MQREPLRETIRRALTDRIVSGELASGDPIRLVATAEELGVSVTPLRESLVQLEIDRFVDSSPGRGYSVAAMTVLEVEEVYPLIWTLEALALRLAPPTPEQRTLLSELNGRFRACEDPSEAHDLDREWHRMLLSQCQNQTLLEFLSLLKRRGARYEVAFMSEMQRARSSRSADQHDEIVACLESGDHDRAVTVLEQNWQLGPSVLLPWLAAR